MYSSPPLIRTVLPSNNSVLIREVSFAEREYHMHSRYLQPKFVSFLEGWPLYIVSFREGPLYIIQAVHRILYIVSSPLPPPPAWARVPPQLVFL